MKLSPITNCSQNHNNDTKLSFSGKLDDSAYSYIESFKKELVREYQTPYNGYLQVLDAVLEVLEDFAKKFHPDTKIRVYRGYESEFHEDFDGPCWEHRVKNVYIEAKNSKLNSNKILGKIEIARDGNCNICNHPSLLEFLAGIRSVVTNTKHTPEKVDKEIFETSKNSFLKKVKQNQKPSFITSFLTRRKAEKLDKIALEFYSTSDTLQQVNSHIDTWSNFYKQTNK